MPSRDLGEKVSFQVVDARELPFDDGQFDVVFSFGVMHHIAGGWRRVVSEVSRVLGPTGMFVFTDFYIPRWLMWLLRVLFPRLDQLDYGPLKEVLAKEGLDVTHQTWERHFGGLLKHGKTVAAKRQAGSG